jgi:hypothetical protein
MPDPTPPPPTGGTGSTGGTNSTENFDTWYANARAIIMNLNTSDDFLTKYISNQFSSVGDGSADSLAKKNALEMLVSRRTELSSMISNILRIIADASRQVISNIRP